MRSLTHFLRSIPTWTLTMPSAIVNSLPPSLWLSLRGERENWKNNTFSAVEDSTLLQWHSGTQKRVGGEERDQIDNEARLFWKSTVKTKHQSLTSLAFIWLVPGADRVVRHICIRCMAATFRVIWLCACIRYWPDRGLVFEYVTCFLLYLLHWEKYRLPKGSMSSSVGKFRQF